MKESEQLKYAVDSVYIRIRMGWNKSGHDGRWPQMFPVEEKLGGEKKLRELIRYAQESGYQVVCHTNSNDCYHISEDYSENLIIKKKDGSLETDPLNWSSGRPYQICTQKAYDLAKRALPKVADFLRKVCLTLRQSI